MEGGTQVMEWLTTATTSLTTLMESVLGLITGNPILAMIFGVGTVIPLGMTLLKKLKRTAR